MTEAFGIREGDGQMSRTERRVGKGDEVLPACQSRTAKRLRLI